MCGSLSTRNVEKVFTPHIIIQYLYISLHISIYEYTTIGLSLSMFCSLAHPVVICRGWSQAWQLSIGHAWFAWNVLILFDLCDLNIHIQIIHIPFCTAVILHMPTIESAFAHATCIHLPCLALTPALFVVPWYHKHHWLYTHGLPFFEKDVLIAGGNMPSASIKPDSIQFYRTWFELNLPLAGAQQDLLHPLSPFPGVPGIGAGFGKKKWQKWVPSGSLLQFAMV